MLPFPQVAEITGTPIITHPIDESVLDEFEFKKPSDVIRDEVITEIEKVNERLSSLGEQMRTLDGNEKLNYVQN